MGESPGQPQCLGHGFSPAVTPWKMFTEKAQSEAL